MKIVRTIPVRTTSASYDVLVGRGLLASLRPRVEKALGRGGRCFFVTTPEVWALWSASALASFPEPKPAVLFLPSGEQAKTFRQVERLATELSAAGADRGTVLLALGGGVIGDVTGFLAAIYMRGLSYIQIPTTFLAQVDSSVGGKTGVNLKTGKNLIGAFHQPALVVVDPETLATLPREQLLSGLFESLKAGLIRDRALFTLMERERLAILDGDPVLLERIIAASIRMKAEVVGEDERESGLRMVLNFGHTLGHAIEATAGYGKLLHGHAVGWGMLAALAISRKRGLPAAEFARAAAAIRAYGLPVLPRLSAERLMQAAAGDKKNIEGKRRFVLLSRIGAASVDENVTAAEILAAIKATFSGHAAQ